MAEEITTDVWFPNIKLSFLKPDGTEAEVDGVPVWASSDETVLAAQPSADGKSGAIQTVAPGGPARVTFTVDADLGEGVKTITGVTPDYMVAMGASGMAAVILVDMGAPVDKAPVPTPV